MEKVIQGRRWKDGVWIHMKPEDTSSSIGSTSENAVGERSNRRGDGTKHTRQFHRMNSNQGSPARAV